jgi:hypothetical protein
MLGGSLPYCSDVAGSLAQDQTPVGGDILAAFPIRLTLFPFRRAYLDPAPFRVLDQCEFYDRGDRAPFCFSKLLR